MVKLSSVNRARAIGQLEVGWKQWHVAVLFGVSQSTISKKLLLRYRDTHAVKDGKEVEDYVSPQTPQTEWIVQSAWWLWGIVASLHEAYRCAISVVMAGGCRYRRTETGYMLPSWNPGKLSTLSNNLVHWWPVCAVSWLTIGTDRFWRISAGPHLSSLGRICRDYYIGTQ